MNEARLIHWTGGLFIIGSALFAIGVLLQLPPQLPALIGGVSYAVGAVFFTAAALCQTVLARRDLPQGDRAWFPWRGTTTDFLAAAIQLVGTVLFNVDTIAYCLTLHSDAVVQDVTTWTPDAVGSLAFLISSGIAMAPEVRERRGRHVLDRAFWVALINLAGSVLFGVSAVAAFVLSDGDLLSTDWTNAGTFFGALCFLVAAWLFAFPHGGLRLAPVPQTRTPRMVTAGEGG